MLLFSDDLFLKETIDNSIQELKGFTGKVLELLEMDMDELGEQNRRALAIFCYGALQTIIKGEKFVNPQVYAITIEVLLHIFQYEEEEAIELAHTLIEVNEQPGNYIQTILNNGILGYYQYAERGDLILKQNAMNQLGAVSII